MTEQVNVSDYATPSNTEALKTTILKNVEDIAKGIHKVLGALGIHKEDQTYQGMFLTIYADARSTFNDTVFPATGVHQ